MSRRGKQTGTGGEETPAARIRELTAALDDLTAKMSAAGVIPRDEDGRALGAAIRRLADAAVPQMQRWLAALDEQPRRARRRPPPPGMDLF